MTKKNETIKMYDCSVHDCTQEFNNANGLLYQESLLRCRDFATLITLRHTSPLYYIGEGLVGGNCGNHVKAQEDRSASTLKVPALKVPITLCLEWGYKINLDSL